MHESLRRHLYPSRHRYRGLTISQKRYRGQKHDTINQRVVNNQKHCPNQDKQPHEQADFPTRIPFPGTNNGQGFRVSSFPRARHDDSREGNAVTDGMMNLVHYDGIRVRGFDVENVDLPQRLRGVHGSRREIRHVVLDEPIRRFHIRIQIRGEAMLFHVDFCPFPRVLAPILVVHNLNIERESSERGLNPS